MTYGAFNPAPSGLVSPMKPGKGKPAMCKKCGKAKCACGKPGGKGKC